MLKIDPAPAVANRCRACRTSSFPIAISMAFQPIVAVSEGRTFAYEALVRGHDGASAALVLAHVDDTNRYAFDQTCRTRAIEDAAKLGLSEKGALLSINFLPNAVYRPEVCIRATLAAAERVGFPLSNIMFEFTEAEQLDTKHVGSIVRAYGEMGFLTAIDDFGAGFSGLSLLADFQPDVIKLDMGLIRDIDRDRVRRTIVTNMIRTAADLGIRVVAEGVETADEYMALRDLGIDLMQGYFFARPGFESLPPVPWASLQAAS